ncbi:MAG: alpha-(1-_3)-arabinofuranosyltransferase family protein [Acidimicrobiales bacterium]
MPLDDPADGASMLRTLLSRVRRHGVLLTAAACAYLPVVFSSPGVVGADTKTYLYLDPGRVLRSATSLWDSDVALGTVTHQNIGYLWPMGPFYWVFETLGSPDWFAQRIWLGTVLFAAGAGVRYLLRTLDWQGRGMLVAVLAYELSPYLLDYSARISAVLLPWAGLPWMIAFTIRAARTQTWRYPAWFALVVLTVGSVNATSLLLVGLAPVAWLVHARFAERSLTTRQGMAAALRIGLLSLGVSVWWIAGLVLQGGYSLPVTRYTETYQTVASASTAPEVFRGLGYWFFYGNDKFGQWIEPSVEYTQGVWLLFISFGLVVLSLFGAALVRWRHRSFFVLLIVLAGFIAIGGHPFDAPSPLGSLFKDFTATDAGLALRSTPRALPMLVLATSVLLGTVINGLDRRWPGFTRVFAVVVLAAVVLNNPAMWRVRMIEEHLQRDEELPDYWIEAIDALNDSGRDGRVMELPGSDFASYRWGNTVDPITPAFLDRGYVARELVPFGSPESADLLTAFDRRFQEDSVDLDSIVPVAQLMSVDDVVHRADLTFERFRTPRPEPTADLLDRTPGLETGDAFGPVGANIAGPEQTLLDEVHLAIDPGLRAPAAVETYRVPDALEIVRTKSVDGALVVVGDGTGLVDAAGAGLIDPERPIWFGADLAADDELRSTVLDQAATIVVTDTNKRRARRWGTLRENLGYTERPGEVPLVDDPTDSRLEIFPGLADAGVDPDDAMTVSRQDAPFAMRASNYGNPVTYTNDDRPAQAIDGDPTTAWVVAAFAEARGEWLEFAYEQPTSLRTITLLQSQAEANRHITEVTIRADGRVLSVVALGEESRRGTGQLITLPAHDPASVYEIELTDLSLGRRPSYGGVSPVGFAEVRMGDTAPVREFLRLPVALTDTIGEDLDRHDLAVVMTRERSNPQEPVRSDPEAEMRRVVELPSARQFALEGSVRVSSVVDERLVDALLGRDRTLGGVGAVAASSGALPGDVASIASFASDGDVTTAWTGVFGPQAGQWLRFDLDEPLTFDSVGLDIVVDDLHSVPTEVVVELDGDPVGTYPTGLTATGGPRGSTASVVVPVRGTASSIVIRVAAVDERPTRDWYAGYFVAMPVSVAEVSIGGAPLFGPPSPVDTGCVGLVLVDGVPIAARVTGSAEDAVERRELDLRGCEDPIETNGAFTVETLGRDVGLDIDQLTLLSDGDGTVAETSAGPVEVVRHDDTHYSLDVPASTAPRWLVLGQSHNLGWEATVDGAALGEPVVIDGFANGWLLPAGPALRVDLDWTPQRLVGRSLVVSALAVLVVLGLALRRRPPGDSLVPARADGPEQPTLRLLPFIDPVRRGPEASWRAVVVAGTVLAAFSWLNLPRLPGLALVVAASLVALLRLRIGWLRPATLAALVLGLTSVAIMVAQKRFRYPPDFGWPQQFADLHVWGVVALLLLAAEYLASIVRPEGD